MAKKRSRKVVNYSRTKRALSQHREEILNLPGVNGISVGPRIKETTDEIVSEPTLRLHVTTPEAKNYLKENADSLGLKRKYGGVGTDIVVLNFREAVSPWDDGDRIIGNGGPGTLGSCVFAELSPLAIVGLTAAHVASRTPRSPQSVEQIFQPGTSKLVGTVIPKHIFYSDKFDAAYIRPEPAEAISDPPQVRIIKLDANDNGKQVHMNGAKSGETKGNIISLSFEGALTNQVHVTDHVLVRHPTSLFAQLGDSGAIVTLRGKWVGMLRAVDESARIAVVSKLKLLQIHTEDLDIAFST